MQAGIVVRSFAALALAASALGGAEAASDVRVLLGIDPAESAGDVLLSASVAPSQSLTRVTGMRTTITQTSSMAEVMRASRTVENEVIIAPAHVTASAILHAYQLLATSGQEQVYALVAKSSIDAVDKLPGKRIYLPQQDSLRSYVAKGLLTESGVKLAQFSKVTYGNTSGGGLVALGYDMADVTIADEGQAKEWIAAHPGQADGGHTHFLSFQKSVDQIVRVAAGRNANQAVTSPSLRDQLTNKHMLEADVIGHRRHHRAVRG